MLTAQENDRLTRVGTGTPMGELQRRYWHPIGALEELETAFTKRVRLLGEDLVLYRDRNGKFGLIGEFCPHRHASFVNGIPDVDGIRCSYHGWKFDGAGAVRRPAQRTRRQHRSKTKSRSPAIRSKSWAA